MNRPDRPASEAVVEYLASDIRVTRPGTFVRCGVTGAAIPLEDLRYWSAERQEAYASPQAVLERIRLENEATGGSR